MGSKAMPVCDITRGMNLLILRDFVAGGTADH